MADTAASPKRLSASTPEADTVHRPGVKPRRVGRALERNGPRTCAAMGTHPHSRRSSHCCGGGDGGEFHVLLGGCGCAALARELAYRFPLMPKALGGANPATTPRARRLRDH